MDPYCRDIFQIDIDMEPYYREDGALVSWLEETLLVERGEDDAFGIALCWLYVFIIYPYYPN